MSNSLAITGSAITIQQFLDQRKLVLDCMKQAMTVGMHYGPIPGCGDKPTLMQSGAQLLCAIFCLEPKYRWNAKDLEGGHKEIEVTCTLYRRMEDGRMREWEGVGFCSSMESKYRFRNAAAIVEETGEPVPKEYWKISDSQGRAEANKWLSTGFDGQKVGIKKNQDGAWQIVVFKGGGDGKVENPNPADVFNTVLKIGKKRAYVDATISATASNDLFTQDLEDIRANLEAMDGCITPMDDEPKSSTSKPADAKREVKKDAPKDQESETQKAYKWSEVKIVEVFTKEGTKKNKEPWKAFFIKFSNGLVAGTFSKTAGTVAETSMANNPDQLFNVTVKKGNKENTWELEDLEDLQTQDDIPGGVTHDQDAAKAAFGP